MSAKPLSGDPNNLEKQGLSIFFFSAAEDG